MLLGSDMLVLLRLSRPSRPGMASRFDSMA
jgi:hypothetical protein